MTDIQDLIDMVEARRVDDMPESGTWAVLYPGYYGPFTACAVNGEWTMAESVDLHHAEYWLPDPWTSSKQ